MLRNVASQRSWHFAFDATTNLPKTGDSANMTCKVSKDTGATASLATNTATELSSTDAPGWYYFGPSQTETDAADLQFFTKSSTSNIVCLSASSGPTTPQYFSKQAIDSIGRGPRLVGFGVRFADPATTPVGGVLHTPAYSPSGDFFAFATGSTSPRIELYSVSRSSGWGAKKSDPATLPAGTTTNLRFEPNGKALAVGHATSPYLSVYPITTSGFGTKYSDPSALPASAVIDCCWSPDGKYFFVATSTTLECWAWTDASGFGTKQTMTSPPQDLNAICFSPDGTTIYFSCTSGNSPNYIGKIAWTGSAFGAITYAGTQPASGSQACIVSPDGAYFLVGYNGGGLLIYPIPSNVIGTPAVATETGPTGNVQSLAIHPAGDIIFTNQGTWRFVSGQLAGRIDAPAGSSFGSSTSSPTSVGVAVSPNGDMVAYTTSLSTPYAEMYPFDRDSTAALPTASSGGTSPTVSQIAAGVWQDTTAGDFTVSGSVGKSVMNGVALGTGLTVNALTNAPTVGDLTATMKTSITTAATAATPTAAAVTGAVGSVTGNVGGNVTGSVGSVVGAVGSVTGAVGSVAGSVGSVTGNVGGNVVGSVGSVTGLTASNLDVAVSTRTKPADTQAAVTTVTNLTNAPTAGDFTTTMKTSIGTAVAASAVASVTGNVGGSVGSVTGLTASNLDATVSSRLATSGYTAPPSAATNASAVMNFVTETGWTLLGVVRVLTAWMSGGSLGNDTGHPVYKSPDATKNRVQADVDQYGNRTNVTTDQT